MIYWCLFINSVISISTVVRLFTIILYWLKPVSITHYLANVYYYCWLFSYFLFLTYIKMHICYLIVFFIKFLHVSLTWCSIYYHCRCSLHCTCTVCNMCYHWTHWNIEHDTVLPIILGLLMTYHTGGSHLSHTAVKLDSHLAQIFFPKFGFLFPV